MKNVVINHQFKLRYILESIKQSGYGRISYQKGYKQMIKKINEYLEMIE